MEKMEKKEFTEGQTHEAMIRLRGAGLTPEGLQRLVENKKLAEQIVEIIEEAPEKESLLKIVKIKLTNLASNLPSKIGRAIKIKNPILRFLVGLGTLLLFATVSAFSIAYGLGRVVELLNPSYIGLIGEGLVGTLVLGCTMVILIAAAVFFIYLVYLATREFEDLFNHSQE